VQHDHKKSCQHKYSSRTVAVVPLEEALRLVEDTFDGWGGGSSSSSSSLLWSQDRTVEYYTSSEIGYRLVHAKGTTFRDCDVDCCVHLGLTSSDDDDDCDYFDPDGYYAQPRTIRKHVEELLSRQSLRKSSSPAAATNDDDEESRVFRVLEIGCGKGFNTLYLLKHFVSFLDDKENNTINMEFVGVDRTPRHVDIAKRKLRAFFVERQRQQRRQRNKDKVSARFLQGDFDDLSSCVGTNDDNDEKRKKLFDVVFAVECLCHSTDLSETFGSIKSVLKPDGGRFIVYDGYRRQELYGQEEQSQPNGKQQQQRQKERRQLRTAQELIETSMAIQCGMSRHEDWLRRCERAGFRVSEDADLTRRTRGTALRLHALSATFFLKFPAWLRRAFLAFCPTLARNAVAGLLMTHCVRDGGSMTYRRTVLEYYGEGGSDGRRQQQRDESNNEAKKVR